MLNLDLHLTLSLSLAQIAALTATWSGTALAWRDFARAVLDYRRHNIVLTREPVREVRRLR